MAKEYYEATGKRVLIINPNGAKNYSAIQSLSYDQLRRWRKGIKQIWNSDYDELLNILADEYSPSNPFNGMIVFEDALNYIPPSVPKPIRKFLTDCRHMNADLLFTFHSLKFVPPWFWPMTNFVMVKRTNDLIEENWNFYQNRIPNMKEIAKAHKQVSSGNKEKDRFKCITVETGV